MFDAPLFTALRAIVTRGLGSLRKPRAARRLQLVETLPLGGKRQLILICCDGNHFLVGAGSDGVSAITPIAPATPAAVGYAMPTELCTSDPLDRSVLQ